MHGIDADRKHLHFKKVTIVVFLKAAIQRTM